jgi:DNA modification methylase
VQGDNVEAIAELVRERVHDVTLAYLDPPFFTQRAHRMADGSHAFDDRWPSLTAFLDSLQRVMVSVRHILAPHGSVVIHVDPKTSHYVKIVGDRVFGVDAFASEIIWRYRRWPTKQTNFQRVHDVLLRYVADPSVEPRWNQLYEPLAPSTIAKHGIGKQVAIWKKMPRSNGKRVRDKADGEVRSHGAAMGDVWDLPILAPSSRERTGYPTQKPEALLERVIGALSDPGDLVLDPYAGIGTTLAVAARMRRDWIGIDCGDAAIRTIRERLGLEERSEACTL